MEKLENIHGGDQYQSPFPAHAEDPEVVFLIIIKKKRQNLDLKY